MLQHLTIRNVALIESLDLDFNNGFSVLTGETGAGKSIIIDALGFVLGERASHDMIMTGKNKASVEAVFQIVNDENVKQLLIENDLEADGDELDLYRELSASGKNNCRICGIPVSTAVLKSIGDALVDIHGQHSHQQLLDQKNHIVILDDFCGEAIRDEKEKTAKSFAELRRITKRIDALNIDEKERERRCDLLNYQIKEIEKAELVPGEEEELTERKSILQNAQSILDGLNSASENLKGENGALTCLSDAVRALERIAPFSSSYEELFSKLNDLYYEVENVSEDASRLRYEFSYDPEELNRIEWRLETISRMKHKYGSDVEEVLSYLDAIRKELSELSNTEEEKQNLESDLLKAASDYSAAAQALSDTRKKTASALSDLITPELRILGMKNAFFSIAVDSTDPAEKRADGIDNVEFLFSANKGEPLKPLSKVASGGELSRIMLAMKTVFSGRCGVMTMVFDEIDTGISGLIASEVAKKMVEISDNRQILCITHLQQIAAYADAHYLITKCERNGYTRSTAVLLREDEKQIELARIMGSDSSDEVALKHARNLLESALNEKAIIREK